MNFVSLLYLVCFTTLNVLAEKDDWITIKKKDLCPALHEEAICKENFVDFDEIAKTIGDLGKSDIISDDEVETGQDASSCGEPLKKAFCSKDARPLCLADKASGDDSEERRVCNELYKTCPSLSSRKSLDYTEECAAYLKRKFSDMTCEAVGVDFKAGGCPRPSRKMPEFYIQVYQAKSNAMKPLENLLDTINTVLGDVWDPECLKTVRELPCMPIYCSETDESVVEMKNKRKDCNRAMECVSKSTEKLSSLTGKLASGLVDQLRDSIKDSCETIIEGFEDLVNPSSDKNKGSGSETTVKLSFSLILLAVMLCMLMFW